LADVCLVFLVEEGGVEEEEAVLLEYAPLAVEGEEEGDAEAVVMAAVAVAAAACTWPSSLLHTLLETQFPNQSKLLL
jgi:hypothetical protein